MLMLDLSNVSRQSFSTTLDDDRYVISIYVSASCYACDISRNEVDLIDGSRIIQNDFLIPFNKQGTSGNFMLLTSNFDLPDYTQFNSTQTLIYMSAAEIAAAVGGRVP